MAEQSVLRHREATAPGMLQASTSAGQLRRGIRELPDLKDRIQALGLQDEYQEFKERYNAWRMGKATGAKGELGAAAGGAARESSPAEESEGASPVASPMGPQDFAYWYPNLGEWRWRRTISFWIGLTFYEGSIFFVVSSFLGCITDALAHNAMAMTTGGLLWGKLHFLICTYLMVVSSINLYVDVPAVNQDHTREQETNGDGGVADDNPLQPVEDGESSDESTSSVLPSAANVFQSWCSTIGTNHSTVEMSTRFRVNPFAYRTALARLNHLGVGPWPYVASLVYFVGCLTFTVGFVAEFAYPHQEWIAAAAFALGSVEFVLGGLAECIENDVFVSLDITTAWIGSLLNLGGGVFFLVGSVVPFFPAEVSSFWGSFWFGVGSALFLIGGSIQLILWRDEQFGLTYLGAFNKLGGSNGQPLVATETDDKVRESASFTWTSLFFIHLFCIAAALSCYDFNLAVGDCLEQRTLVSVHRMFNELIPMIILHMEIALRSAVVRTPQFAPYHQLFIAMRLVAIVLIFDSVIGFISLWE